MTESDAGIGDFAVAGVTPIAAGLIGMVSGNNNTEETAVSTFNTHLLLRYW